MSQTTKETIGGLERLLVETVPAEVHMRYHEARELAALRQRLRDHLIAQDVAAASSTLQRLREVADGDMDLRAEYERWSFRFELLAAA